MTASPHVFYQRMGSGTSDPGITPTPVPVVGVYSDDTVFTEGATVGFYVRRGIYVGATCSVTWTLTPASVDDLPVGQPLTGVLTVPAGETEVPLRIPTLNRSGLQGARELSVVLSAPSGCNIDPTRITHLVTINDAETISGDFEFPLGWPKRKIYVSVAGSGDQSGGTTANRMPLATAKAAAVPGDYLVIAGPVTGTLLLDQNGTIDLPIVLGVDGAVGGAACDLSNILSVKFSQVTLNLNGDYCFLWGIDFDGELLANGMRVNMRGQDVRLQRCDLHGWRSPALATASGWAGVVVQGPKGDQGMVFCRTRDWEGRGVTNTNQTSARALRPYFFRSIWEDNVPRPGGGGNARECIQAGETQVGSSPEGQRCHYRMGMRIVECLFRNLYNPGGQFDEFEIVSIKSSDNGMIRCDVENTPKFLSGRFGVDNFFESIRMHNAGGIVTYGDRTRIFSCVTSGDINNRHYRISSGTQTMDVGPTQTHPNGPTAPDAGDFAGFTPWGGDADPDGSDEPTNRDAYIAGCTGTLIVGLMPRAYAQLRCTDTVIEQHIGVIHTERAYPGWGREHTVRGPDFTSTPTGCREYDTIYRATATIVLPPQPVALNPDECGPFALWRPIVKA